MGSLEAIREKEQELAKLKEQAIGELLKQREAIDEQLRELGYSKRGRNNGKVRSPRKGKAKAATS